MDCGVCNDTNVGERGVSPGGKWGAKRQTSQVSRVCLRCPAQVHASKYAVSWVEIDVDEQGCVV